MEGTNDEYPKSSSMPLRLQKLFRFALAHGAGCDFGERRFFEALMRMQFATFTGVKFFEFGSGNDERCEFNWSAD